jgi:hypothetical protein
MKINSFALFNLMLKYINYDILLELENWEIACFLHDITMMAPHTYSITSPTLEPAYWYDWKELIEEELSNDQSILDEKNGVTLEQGLVAVQYFIKHKYWIKNKDMLLKDAYADLVIEYSFNKDNSESSQLWQEWSIAVQEGKKFDKIFIGDDEN